MVTSNVVSADERKWRAESDANTLAEAEAIKADIKRNAAAKKAAGNMAKEASKRVKSLSKVASKPVTKSNTKIPGVKKK